jgi:hypothetical protein
LAEIDKALAAKPRKDDTALAQATTALCTLRDAMIERHRARPLTGDDRTRLLHLNAVISTVLAVHFPLGEVQWGELEKARGWLGDLLRFEGGPG